MLTPCLDPQFAQHLNAFWRAAGEAVREWFIGLSPATVVLLLFATIVISTVIAISGHLTYRDMRAPGWTSSEEPTGPRVTLGNTVAIALAILLAGMADMWQ
jgi:hypothetical protein